MKIGEGKMRLVVLALCVSTLCGCVGFQVIDTLGGMIINASERAKPNP